MSQLTTLSRCEQSENEKKKKAPKCLIVNYWKTLAMYLKMAHHFNTTVNLYLPVLPGKRRKKKSQIFSTPKGVRTPPPPTKKPG